MKKLTVAMMVIITSGISGCATIMSGSTQTIDVQAIGYRSHKVIQGAKCTIRDGKGNLYVVPQNPGNVIVSKGNGALQVHCLKSGYKQKSVGHGQSFNAWTLGNIIFWPGAIIDAADGAYAKYPSHIIVLMEKKRRRG